MRNLRSFWAGIGVWDRRFVAGWVLVPFAFFLIPALFGHPIIAGDGVGQNLPLRALAGVDFRHGHLPTWDPYIWSGTPLLAGFNAGAFYPVTFLFAVLPGTIAWSITQSLVITVSGLGMYCFLRLHRLAPAASAVGAASWCTAGFMGAQLVHIASVQGWGWVTWMLVALQRIAAGPRTHRGRWAAALGLVIALIILVGDPESMVEGSMLAGVYGLSLLWRHRDLTIVPWVAGGVVAGLAVGAAQWVPGLALAQASQRSQVGWHFFVGGSVAPPEVPLLFVPYLDGGFGHFGVPYYFGGYSLVELSGYAGIVALAAIFSMVLLWRKDPKASDWRPWYLIGAVGMVLALGENTPVAQWMFHVPLYKLLRLPSRNLAWVDLSASVLAGFWVDRVLLARRAGRSQTDEVAGRSRDEGLAGRSLPEDYVRLQGPVGVAAVTASLVPAVVVVAALASLLVDGKQVISTLAAVPLGEAADHLRAVTVTTALQAVIAVGFAVMVLRAGRTRRRRTLVVLAVVLFADVAFYGLNQQWVQTPSTKMLAGTSVEEKGLRSALATAGGGRFAIFDPNRYHSDQLDKLGQPDINIMERISSVQGYGSIVPAAYANATDTHQQLTFSTAALASGTFQQLGLSVLLAPFEYFAIPTAAPPAHSRSGAKGDTYAFPPPSPPANEPVAVDAGGVVDPHEVGSWFWGQQSRAASIDVVATVSSAEPDPSGAGRFQVGLIQPGGSIRWLPASRLIAGSQAGGYELLARRSTLDGVGIAIRPTGPWTLDVTSIQYSDAKGFRYHLSGALSQALKPGTWTYEGVIDDYAVYVDNRGSQANHLALPGDGTVEVFRPDPWGTQSYLVNAHRATTMIRSVSYAPGWRVSLVPANRIGSAPVATVTESVSSDGLVQSVRVPRGSWLATFSYHPPKVAEGLLATSGGVVLLVLLVLVGSGRGLFSPTGHRRVFLLMGRRRWASVSPSSPTSGAGDYNSRS